MLKASCMKRRVSFVWIQLLLFLLCCSEQILPLDAVRHFLAFAGGGFGKRTRSVSSTSSEVDAPPLPSKTPKTRRRKGLVEDVFTDVSIINGKKNKNPSPPKLDKWGLPIPTVDDIFPPLPPDTTELMIAATEKDPGDYSLTEIQAALQNHIPLTLPNRFDENGFEKTTACPSTSPGGGRKRMKLRLLHVSPPVLSIDNYFTEEECLEILQVAAQSSSSKNGAAVQVDSKTFDWAISKRTSTSWFCRYEQVPVFLAKAWRVLGIPLEQMEEPQIVRYQAGQEFSWHYDQVPLPQLDNGGQRLATLLVYLNTVPKSGGTVFRDLVDSTTGQPLTMRPKQGSALLFFPAFANGQPDDRTLHKGEIVAEGDGEKWIIQMWIHQHAYRAVVPPNNRQQDALPAVREICQQLGYDDNDSRKQQ